MIPAGSVSVAAGSSTKVPSGVTIWRALREELLLNMYELPTVTLPPTVFYVYLHPKDFTRIEGPLGNRYGIMAGELTPDNGNPLVMRSDFYHLDDALDAQLDGLYGQIQAFDVDGDARLRINHGTESDGITEAYMIDYDGNEYVDDFDLFLAFFDANADGMVCYDEDLALGAGYGGLSGEMDADAAALETVVPDEVLVGVVDEEAFLRAAAHQVAGDVGVVGVVQHQPVLAVAEAEIVADLRPFGEHDGKAEVVADR